MEPIHALAPVAVASAAPDGMMLLDASLRPLACDAGAASILFRPGGGKECSAGNLEPMPLPELVRQQIRRRREGVIPQRVRFQVGAHTYTAQAYAVRPTG